LFHYCRHMQSIKDIMEEKKKKLEEGRGRKSIWKWLGIKILRISRHIMSLFL
jgi:hypothetical protein